MDTLSDTYKRYSHYLTEGFNEEALVESHWQIRLFSYEHLGWNTSALEDENSHIRLRAKVKLDECFCPDLRQYGRGIERTLIFERLTPMQKSIKLYTEVAQFVKKYKSFLLFIPECERMRVQALMI